MARLTIVRGVTLVLLGLLVSGQPAVATEGETTHTEVKRSRTKGPQHPSLEFLRANRVFIRSQLDQLRLLTTRKSDGQIQLLDERLLRLQELAAEIAAARDTVAVAGAATARRELLASVNSLSELDRQLGTMERIAAAQRARLQELDADFLGQQETAVVILVRGLPTGNEPGGITLSDDNEAVRVPFSALEQQSLRQGGVAQIFHRFVEPRDHVYQVGFQGAQWAASAPVAVPVSAVRDHITFVELDLSALTPTRADNGLTARVWVR